MANNTRVTLLNKGPKSFYIVHMKSQTTIKQNGVRKGRNRTQLCLTINFQCNFRQRTLTGLLFLVHLDISTCNEHDKSSEE